MNNIIFIAILLIFLSGNVVASPHGTDACQSYINKRFDSDQLFNSISRSLLAGYFQSASEIEYKIVESGVTPVAISPVKGRKVIEVPRAFIVSACYFSNASSLGFDLLTVSGEKLKDNFTNFYSIWQKAESEKESCQTNSDNYEYDKCFLAYAKLVSVSADEFRKKNSMVSEPLAKDRLIYEAESLVKMIIYHEISHHVENHFSQIENKSLSRKDAEWSADIFAALSALQNGHSAMSYIHMMEAIGIIEDQTKQHPKGIYDSGWCRAINAGLFSAATSEIPLLLVQSTRYGGLNNLDVVDSIKKLKLNASPTTFSVDEKKKKKHDCNFYSEDGLKNISKGVFELADFLSNYSDIIWNMKVINKPLPPVSGSAFDLIEKLASFKVDENLSGLRAKLLLIIIRRWYQSNELSGLNRSNIGTLKSALELVSKTGVYTDAFNAFKLSTVVDLALKISAEKK